MRRLIPLLAMSIATLQGCGGGDDVSERAIAIAALSGDAAVGETFFSGSCAVCHGDDATGIGGLGSDLTTTVPSLTDGEIAQTFLTPPDRMIAFSEEQDQTLANVIAYLRTL